MVLNINERSRSERQLSMKASSCQTAGDVNIQTNQLARQKLITMFHDKCIGLTVAFKLVFIALIEYNSGCIFSQMCRHIHRVR